jgi:hypothetical protein
MRDVRSPRGKAIHGHKRGYQPARAAYSVYWDNFPLPLGARTLTGILPINQGFRCPSGRATDFSGSNWELRLLELLPAVYSSYLRCPLAPKSWRTLPFPHMDFRRPGATEFPGANAVSRLPEASSTFPRQDSPCPSGGATQFSGSNPILRLLEPVMRFLCRSWRCPSINIVRRAI